MLLLQSHQEESVCRHHRRLCLHLRHTLPAFLRLRSAEIPGICWINVGFEALLLQFHKNSINILYRWLDMFKAFEKIKRSKKPNISFLENTCFPPCARNKFHSIKVTWYCGLDGCDQIIVTTTWLQFNVISMVFRSVVCSLYATKILHVLEIGLYANSDEKIGNLQEDDLPI